MRQGAVGAVRLIERDGRRLVEKRMTDETRHDTEVRALRALSGSGVPAPELVDERTGSIVMTELPGVRVDELDLDDRLDALRRSAPILRAVHRLDPPPGLPPAPDDAAVVARYRASDGPALPLVIPAASGVAFCHGDWTDGNLLTDGRRITGVVDWEAAHLGDPMRELARAAWGASRKDPRG